MPQQTPTPHVRQESKGRRPSMSLGRVIVRTLLLSIVILGFGAMSPGITIVSAQKNRAASQDQTFAVWFETWGPVPTSVGSLDPTFGVGGKATTSINTQQVT